MAGVSQNTEPDAWHIWLGVAWIWPVLLWSKLGVHETLHRTGPIIFVTLLTGSGVGLYLARAGLWGHLLGWGVAALFIPTLALTLGIWSGTRKFFEALYVVLWYMGPMQRLDIFDYMGLSQAALDRGMPRVYLGITVVLFIAALIGRRRQICR